MSRLVIPLRSQALWSTGDMKVWTGIDLHLNDGSGNWWPEPFLMDTGTKITTFPAHDAKRLGLLMPQRANPGAVHTQTGLAIRAGLLCFKVGGMDQTEYTTPCLFLGDPDTPPDPAQPAKAPPKLLQPFALLERLRFTLQKDPAVGSLYGKVVVEKV